MTVEELIALLKEMPQDSIVVIARDEEGNGFRPVYTVDSDMRFNSEDGEIGYKELTDVMRLRGYTDEDVMDEGVGENCVILWP